MSRRRTLRVAAIAGAFLLVLALAAWYQSAHQLAIEVHVAERTVESCPDGVSPCFPLEFRVAHRWFGDVYAICTVAVRSADGRVIATKQLNTGDVPLLVPEVGAWSTIDRFGWLDLKPPSRPVTLSARCSSKPVPREPPV